MKPENKSVLIIPSTERIGEQYAPLIQSIKDTIISAMHTGDEATSPNVGFEVTPPGGHFASHPNSPYLQSSLLRRMLRQDCVIFVVRHGNNRFLTESAREQLLMSQVLAMSETPIVTVHIAAGKEGVVPKTEDWARFSTCKLTLYTTVTHPVISNFTWLIQFVQAHMTRRILRVDDIPPRNDLPPEACRVCYAPTGSMDHLVTLSGLVHTDCINLMRGVLPPAIMNADRIGVLKEQLKEQALEIEELKRQLALLQGVHRPVEEFEYAM